MGHTGFMDSSRATLAPPPLLQHLWTSTLVSGLLAIALGVAVSAWPGQTVLVAGVVFGVYLLISGITQVVFAFGLHATAGSRILMFISGAASLVLALLAFRHFGDAVLLLAIWVGVGFIFRGVATTVSAVSDPDMPGRGWALFIGIVNLLAGIIVMAWPFESIVTLAYVIGIWLIVLGVFEVISSFGIRKASKAPKASEAVTG